MHSKTGVETADIETAAIQAEKVYDLMTARNKVFGDKLFHDPAWSILLDLFIAHNGNRMLSISDVCVGSRVPFATCLRYITMLTEAGLIVRKGDRGDRRRVNILLTDKAIVVLADLLDNPSTRLREYALAFDHRDVTGMPANFDRLPSGE